MREQNNTTSIGTNGPNSGFIPEDLVPILNFECINKKDFKYLPKPPVSVIGIVVGILTMNSEVEILVQFPEGIQQLCKSEFNKNYILVGDNE